MVEMNSTNFMVESSHTSDGSNLAALAELSSKLVETESTLSAFWLLAPTLKLITCKGKIIKVSPMFDTLLGYNVDDLVGTDYKTLIHPDDIPAVNETEALLDDGYLVKNFVCRLKCNNSKEYIPIEWSTRQDPYSKFNFSNGNDIRDKAQKEIECPILQQYNISCNAHKR